MRGVHCVSWGADPSFHQLGQPQRLLLRGQGRRLCRRSQKATAALSPRTQQLVAEWLQLDKDPSSVAQLQELVAREDEAALQDALGQRLKFGTAGLRGRMGPGTNRMNAVTVQQTSQGLLRYLQREEAALLASGGVAIGFDARHHSRELATIVAAVFLSQGIQVHLFSQIVPTPFVPAAVELLGCAGGVMVTASHNPKQDNGYKVYWSNACQIIPPHDEGIAAAIERHLALWQLPPPGEVTYQHRLLSDPLDAVAGHYYSALASKLCYRGPAANATAAHVCYTALHGVGTPWVQRAFRTFGLPPPVLVEQQCSPDPEFPTVPFPNPEEGKGAWQLSFAAAEEAGVCLALANDPDADRLSAAERDPVTGAWRTFSGNEIGAMLAVWVLENYRSRRQQQQEEEGSAERLAVLSSTVSSRMLAAIAAQEGVHWEDTLTGFKWLGNRAIELEQQGYTVLFAFEEAIGFMLGQIEHDKDGVAAAVVFAELAADLYSRGLTLAQHWAQMQARYGAFAYRSSYFLAQPPSKSAGVFERLRERYPEAVGGLRVQAMRDLGTGLDTAQPDQRATLHWRRGDLMITFTLEGGALITLRASGTEPKLKYYVEARGSEELAAALEAAVVQELIQPQRHDLQPRPPQ